MTLKKLPTDTSLATETGDEVGSAVLHRHLHHKFPSLVRGSGNNLTLDNGQIIFDASGGAAVACIGHGNARVVNAAMRQMSEVAYCATIFYTTDACEELCRVLVNSTNGRMARAYIVNSGEHLKSFVLKSGPKMSRVGGHGGSNEAGQAVLS